VGGSNRLLSVDELAAYLGVPKKTVYGCWRQWGLRGYRVGRYLRFRERHVEEWLRNQGAVTIMASIIKRLDCGDWDDCPHPWVVRYRTEGGRASRQREQPFGDGNPAPHVAGPGGGFPVVLSQPQAPSAGRVLAGQRADVPQMYLRRSTLPTAVHGAFVARARTALGSVRGMFGAGASVSPGDPAKMAAIIIGSVDRNPAPKRIVLGSDSYGILVNALTQRLADIEPQKDLAASTDFVAAPGGPK